jgi:hypothetical protein
VSEMSQGPGWWIASDGKWYAPESHPDLGAPAPATSEGATPPASPPAEAPAWPASADPAPDPTPLGPKPAAPASRWLGKSAQPPASLARPGDIRPTSPGAAPPPRVEPSMTAPVPAMPSVSPAMPSVAPAMPTIATPTDYPPVGPSSAPREKSAKKAWTLSVVAVLALAVAALVVALVSGSGSGSSSLLDGSSTATIHIVVPRSGQPTFSGTVGGMALTGTVINSTSSSGTGSSSGTLSLSGPVFTYEGTLGGAPYVLHVSLNALNSSGQLTTGQITFAVNGTYGSKIVTATASFSLASLTNEGSQTVSFSCRVGTQSISGSATATQDGSGSFMVTGRLNAVSTG